MKSYDIVSIRDRAALVAAAAAWFHSIWGIPEAAYLESMEQCLMGQGAVPQWYVVLDGQRIVGGLGVIENDFHERKDLAPNVCAVYVEKDCRGQGIARKMLDYACNDMRARGVETLYLLTNHTSLYERYGWTFYCTAMCDGETKPSRVYLHGRKPTEATQR